MRSMAHEEAGDPKRERSWGRRQGGQGTGTGQRGFAAGERAPAAAARRGKSLLGLGQ